VIADHGVVPDRAAAMTTSFPTVAYGPTTLFSVMKQFVSYGEVRPGHCLRAHV